MASYKYAPYVISAIVLIVITPLLIAMLQPQPTVEGFATLVSLKRRTWRTVRQALRRNILFAKDTAKRLLKRLGV